MEIIKRFLSSGLFIETGNDQQLSEGDTVEVMDGPLRGLKGNVLRSAAGNKFLFSLNRFNKHHG